MPNERVSETDKRAWQWIEECIHLDDGICQPCLKEFLLAEITFQDNRHAALLQRVEELSETYTDERGTVWSPPTAEAYEKACKALHTKTDRLTRLEAALREYGKHPHWCGYDKAGLPPFAYEGQSKGPCNCGYQAALDRKESP